MTESKPGLASVSIGSTSVFEVLSARRSTMTALSHWYPADDDHLVVATCAPQPTHEDGAHTPRKRLLASRWVARSAVSRTPRPSSGARHSTPTLPWCRLRCTS